MPLRPLATSKRRRTDWNGALRLLLHEGQVEQREKRLGSPEMNQMASTCRPLHQQPQKRPIATEKPLPQVSSGQASRSHTVAVVNRAVLCMALSTCQPRSFHSFHDRKRKYVSCGQGQSCETKNISQGVSGEPRHFPCFSALSSSLSLSPLSLLKAMGQLATFEE